MLEAQLHNIIAISSANKADCFTEQKVPPELCDACILAQKENLPLLTDDFLYLKANEIETGKIAPEYCSSFVLIHELLEQKKIDFDLYLNYFSYLSSYRCRFLAISTDDIKRAVFGDGNIILMQPERIRQFNFPLTLSEEYGVPFNLAFNVVEKFLLKVFIDYSILPETANKIFAEIISEFPTDLNRYILGKMFIDVIAQSIKKLQRTIIIGNRIQKKVEFLLQSIEIYKPNLWTP
jgi:uncharacterized protein YejL (UPF0352 family)